MYLGTTTAYLIAEGSQRQVLQTLAPTKYLPREEITALIVPV